MKNFESELIDLAQNVEFRHFDNALQRNLKRICSDIKEEPKLIIPADKTHNFYKITTEEHNNLRKKDVEKNFKRVRKKTVEKIKNHDLREIVGNPPCPLLYLPFCSSSGKDCTIYAYFLLLLYVSQFFSTFASKVHLAFLDSYFPTMQMVLFRYIFFHSANILYSLGYNKQKVSDLTENVIQS